MRIGHLLRTLVVLFAGVALVGAGWWAARVALESPDDPLGTPEPVMYEIINGSVGRSLRFVAVAEWPVEDLARNTGSGIVTTVDIGRGDTVDAGDVLYTLDLRPVVVAKGTVPAFRDMAVLTEGPDVAQLQVFLSDMGFYGAEADGKFGSGTRDAVREWQKTTGVPDDGVVRAGDVVFIPELPVRVILDAGVTVGAPLVGGEATVRRLAGDPSFTIPLLPEQRSLVPLDAVVLVSHSGVVWDARISTVREDDAKGQLLVDLEASDGGSVCGDDCAAEVSLVGTTDFSVEVVVVPETTGPVIPMAAIETAPDGTMSVTTPGGVVPIEIIASADGLAVVGGVSVGDRIVLPVTGTDS